MAPERLTRNGMVSLVGSGLAAVGALALTALVGHFLGARGTGLFFQAVGIFTVLTQVLRLGTNSGIVRFIAAERAYGRRGSEWRIVGYAAIPVAVLAVAISCGVWWYSERLAAWLATPADQAELSTLLRAMAPFVVAGAISGVLQIAARMVRGVASFTMLQSVLPALSRLATVLVALLSVTTASAAFEAWLVPVPVWLVVTVAVIVPPLVRDWRRRGDRAPDAPTPRAFWRFNAPRALGSAFETGLDWSDVLIVAALASPAEAGVYAVASRAVKAGQVVDKAMRVAVAPTISALLARDETAAATRLHTRVVRGMVVVTWPFYLLLAFDGPAVLAVFGPEFTVGWPVLSILAVSTMLQTSTGMLQSILLQGGRSSWQMLNKGIALGISVLLNILLVPEYGIVGAGLTWAAVVLIDTALAASQVHRGLRVRLEPRRLVGVATVATVVFGLGGLALRATVGASLLGTAAGTVVLGLVYAGALWLLRRQLDIVYLWAKVPGLSRWARGA